MSEVMETNIRISSDRIEGPYGSFWRVEILSALQDDQTATVVATLGEKVWERSSTAIPLTGSTHRALIVKKSNGGWSVREILCASVLTAGESTPSTAQGMSKPESAVKHDGLTDDRAKDFENTQHISGRITILSDEQKGARGLYWRASITTAKGDTHPVTLFEHDAKGIDVRKGPLEGTAAVSKSSNGFWRVTKLTMDDQKEVNSALDLASAPDEMIGNFIIDSAAADGRAYFRVTFFADAGYEASGTISFQILKTAGVLPEGAVGSEQRGLLRRNANGRWNVARVDGIPDRFDSVASTIIERKSSDLPGNEAVYTIEIDTGERTLTVQIKAPSLYEAGFETINVGATLVLNWTRKDANWHIASVPLTTLLHLYELPIPAETTESANTDSVARYTDVHVDTFGEPTDFWSHSTDSRAPVTLAFQTRNKSVRLRAGVTSALLKSRGLTVLRDTGLSLQAILTIADGHWVVEQLLAIKEQPVHVVKRSVHHLVNLRVPCDVSVPDAWIDHRMALEWLDGGDVLPCYVRKNQLEKIDETDVIEGAIMQCDLIERFNPKQQLVEYYVSKIHRISG